MLARLKNWLNDKFSTGDSTSADRLKRTATYVAAHATKSAAPKPSQTVSPDNAPARNKYIREDIGTHETLSILDSSVVDPDDEAGIDPYNTGEFDRSKNWNKGFRK
jgi:hypothetical protein